MERKIWLIGGTKESVTIAKAIATTRLPLAIAVATSAARSLYPPDCEVWVGRMDRAAMSHFCRQGNIAAIVDASHPYAVEVSQNAIATATAIGIPYLRYERPLVHQLSIKNTESVVELDSFESLIEGNYLQGERVLLTVGCQALPLFKSWHHRSTLFARILPKLESVEVALAAGFTSEKIIALRPPIGAELEKALWRQWQISLVVTKASGKPGGEDIKRAVAKELGIGLIVITRPKVVYPQQTSCINEIMVFCREHYFKYV
ncbi:cobalt-precorrin-6A reductase [Pleurocapsales cyanobacterium LEGE 06147]|nr:cobalt-precorrin-6A reductase [Pleurocapsales cyanobacterium LEGE 06147]